MRTKQKSHRIGMVSLGCAKNLVDSEKLMKQLEANRFELVFDPDESSGIDTAIINTCGFINDAKEESIETILKFVNAKQHKTLDYIYVMGCLSERYKSRLMEEIPEVDAYFGVNDLRTIIQHLGGKYRSTLLGERISATPSHYAYLKIAEGCDRNCSFCAIPKIRGKHISRPVELIVAEARQLIRAGVKEINLISQDTTYYGIDLYKKRMLPELLDKLASLQGLDWLRLHYTYPDGFPADILEVMNRHANICKYIDMPLQHISDRILRSMQRGMDGQSTRDLINKIREKVPGVALRTTFIAGYPGETDAEFRELMEFVGETRFDRMGVFSYSHEEDTRAFQMRDSIPSGRKAERVEKLMTLQEGISHSLNLSRIGKRMKVLIDRKENEFLVARTEYDSPEVDNEVLIRDADHAPGIGSFAEVIITKAEPFDLYAEFQ